MQPLVSVIVPIYNVEKYLDRAVESIVSQTYGNLEIILVDDGSTDSSAVICDRWQEQDSRIRVIHKENGGLSDARNAGLDIATGEYIVFVDSDDFLADLFVEVLWNQLSETDSDVAFCTYQVVEGEERPEFCPPAREQISCFDREGLLLGMYDALQPDATYFIVSWNKLYRSSLWEGIRFPKGRIHEDEATTYRIFDRTARGVFVRCPLYGYFSAPASITRDRFSIRRLDWMKALSDRIDFFEQKGEMQMVIPAMRARADASIRYYYRLRDEVPDSLNGQQELKGYVRTALGFYLSQRSASQSILGLSTRFGYRLFLCSPFLYKIIARI